MRTQMRTHQATQCVRIAMAMLSRHQTPDTRHQSPDTSPQTPSQEHGPSESVADSSSAKPAARAAPTRGHRLPADWVLPKDWGDWALAEYPQWTAQKVRREGASFRDHWMAKSGKDAVKLDWLATWRNWCRSGIAHRDDPKSGAARGQQGTAERNSEAMRLLGFSDDEIADARAKRHAGVARLLGFSTGGDDAIELTLADWLARAKERGESWIPEGDPIFEFAQHAGIPRDWLWLASESFKDRYRSGRDADKRYRDWRAVFRDAVKDGGWIGVWRHDAASNSLVLTTKGAQLQSALAAAEGAR